MSHFTLRPGSNWEPPYPYVARMTDGSFRVILKGELLGTFTKQEAALAFSRLAKW